MKKYLLAIALAAPAFGCGAFDWNIGECDNAVIDSYEIQRCSRRGGRAVCTACEYDDKKGRNICYHHQCVGEYHSQEGDMFPAQGGQQ